MSWTVDDWFRLFGGAPAYIIAPPGSNRLDETAESAQEGLQGAGAGAQAAGTGIGAGAQAVGEGVGKGAKIGIIIAALILSAGVVFVGWYLARRLT